MCSNLREFTYYSKYDNMRKRCFIKCGFCLECQNDRSTEWAQRLMLEARKHKDVCFLTLTYAQAPVELQIRDFQLFMKRLRKKISPVKVLYFCSGEYGEENGRPHFHVILFGWKPSDLLYFGKTKRGEDIYVSKLIENTWQHGFISVGELNFRTAFYTCKYMQKFAYTDDSKRRPFVTMSTSVTLGFDRDSLKNLEKPTFFVNGIEKAIPNSLLRRAEKEGFDISGVKIQRESFIQNTFEDKRIEYLKKGMLGPYEADRGKQREKDLKKMKKKY